MRVLIFVFMLAVGVAAQMPPIEPGVSHDLAKWRAARYSDVRYKLNLTLEKMSPVLKGTIEIRVRVSSPQVSKGNSNDTQPQAGADESPQIILDWRKIAGHEKDSTITNVSINDKPMELRGGGAFQIDATTKPYIVEDREHLIFGEGVKPGENVIKLDFTSPILTSGSAITRYVDKEDGAEYIYSLFVPSDASTAFPVFDQPDLKARFSLTLHTVSRKPDDSHWSAISNTKLRDRGSGISEDFDEKSGQAINVSYEKGFFFEESEPISTYVFAFATGPFKEFVEGNSDDTDALPKEFWTKDKEAEYQSHRMLRTYVRNSQATKFKPYASEVFRLTREGIKYLETYFDYKFPFPKYDLVLIPEFPFGGMEHAGATFLREASVIFPTEPTKNDQISRANLIFHETAHQWFGDTVTMKWFDDLWLKEGFAEFMAYKTLEKVMPEANAWKVFYERNKQAAYQTDSTRGTTPIYQEIANLSAARSAYGNIVYRKAPSFLRQAEFYLGEDKFQTAVRAFLKKHEFANAGWEDLVKEFEAASGQDLKEWAKQWVTQRGLPVFRVRRNVDTSTEYWIEILPSDALGSNGVWQERLKTRLVTSFLYGLRVGAIDIKTVDGKMAPSGISGKISDATQDVFYFFPNYEDYGYGIFLLDDKTRDYVLKNIQNEKDPFLRTMIWGSLWDSVREAELDPKNYVELVIKNLSTTPPAKSGIPPKQGIEQDEGTIQTLLGRVSTAMNYYVSDAQRAALAPKVEALLIDRIQNASTAGQRITFYRAFLGIASTTRATDVVKQILRNGSPPDSRFPLKSKDRFDIVTRLIIIGDPEAPKLLADLEKTETGDDAKRYAYASKAGAATAENKAKYWNDFLTNKDISESWIEAAMGPFNSIRHTALTQQYLTRALAELPNLKRSRKIFFVNGWLGAFIGGQRDEKALAIVNKFLADNPNLDNDLRLKVLENVDLIERAVKIRTKYGKD